MTFPIDSNFDVDKSLKIVRGHRKKHYEKPDGKHELKLSFANAAKLAGMYLVHKYTCKVIKNLLSNEI